MSPAKVVLVPLSVSLTTIDSLLAHLSVGKQMVDELDGEDFDLVDLLEPTHVDVVALRDIEEDAVDEKEEGLDVEELAPREAQVEEELCQALIVNSSAVKGISLAFLPHLFHFLAAVHPLFLLRIHETLVFLIELFTALTLFLRFRVILLFVDLFKVISQLLGLLLLLLLPL